MNKHIRDLIRQKKKLQYKLLASNNRNITQDSKAELKALRTKVNVSIKSRIAEYEYEIARDKKNPKRLFQYTNSRQKITSSIDSIYVKDKLSSDPATITNTLNKQF